ncbi:MAG: sporulation protein YunB [Bacilli bacterium]|nr:sporulation protein YunB [Bacilli bacterium]
MKSLRKLKILTVICLIIFIPLVIVSFADNYYSDRTTMYIGKQIELASTRTFQEVINKSVLNEVDVSELVVINYSSVSNVSSVIINTKLVNQILDEAHIVIEDIFDKHLEEYFLDLEIPLGTLISKSIFSGIGPIIRIPITPVGSYKIDVLTNTVSYGINNSLVELYLAIDVDIEALIPLQKKSFPNETKIIILSTIIQGEVPKYYYSSNSNESFPYIPSDN